MAGIVKVLSPFAKLVIFRVTGFRESGQHHLANAAESADLRLHADECFSRRYVQRAIAVATPPGETNRLFVLERFARVSVITNLASPNRTTFLDITSRVTTRLRGGLLGIVFHPGYATNGYFYLFYTLSTNTTAGSGRHQRAVEIHFD